MPIAPETEATEAVASVKAPHNADGGDESLLRFAFGVGAVVVAAGIILYLFAVFQVLRTQP